jgi:hypothetical protein
MPTPATGPSTLKTVEQGGESFSLVGEGHIHRCQMQGELETLCRTKIYGVLGRGGNGSDIALSHIYFHIFKINTDANTNILKYECGADVIRIRIQIGFFFQYETDTNKKIIDLYLIVSEVYNDIIHNSLKSNKKILLTTFLAFLVRSMAYRNRIINICLHNFIRI